MPIQLVTFGGLRAEDETGELERLLTQHTRAALLIYLAVERRVSRETLTTIFWPESDAENARHALRQSLYHLRNAIGRDWIDSRAHELVVSDDVRTDAQAFTTALERGDTETAVRLYQGPFLDGVHLVDLSQWESWVDSRRAQYARAFRKAFRELIEAKRGAGDLAGAIEAAERWTARDPLDDEAQHRLIEALAVAGERAEAIRQYETYARMLEPDGLTPLDETRELAERLRSEAGPLPVLRAAPMPASQPAPQPAPASIAPNEAGGGRRPLRVLAAAVVAIALAGVAWSLRPRQEAHSEVPAAATIAVLPFSVRGGEAVQYLGEGLVNLLGTALDGAGSLRPVDTRATFAAVGEEGDSVPDAERGERVAARLGAGMFVLGDVVEAGGQLQIEAAVYSADARCARALRDGASAKCTLTAPRSSAVVSGSADSVFALVDRLAARLLGGLGDPAADRLLHTAATTTTSLPAFKAYLQGEGAMRAGQFERAADDYLAAIGLDSTFAVAHYRLALAREWAPLPGEEDAANDAARHSARLSTRDRMLLEAFREWRSGAATSADRAYRTILARYPDDIDAWFQLGEIQFHHGPLLGRALGESEEAWRKVLSAEPRNLFAIAHLGRIAAVARRTATMDSLLAPFAPEELRRDRRLAELAILRAVVRGDRAEALAAAREMRRGESFAILREAVFLATFSTDPVLMREVVDELSIDYPNAALRSDLYWVASLLDLAGGRLDSSRVSLARATNTERAVPANRRRSGFGEATQWLAATLPLPYADSTLMRVRQEAASVRAPEDPTRGPFAGVLGIGLPIQFEPLRQYTLGMLALRLGDTVSGATAAAALQRLAAQEMSTTLVRDLDRGLRARFAWHQKRPQEALRLLEALELHDQQGDIAMTPFVPRANERFLRAEVLTALGRDAEALQWLASLGSGSVSEIPLQAPSHLRQAEIYARLGNRDEAVKHYARFFDLWREVGPEFQPLVDSARLGLRTLQGRE